MFNVSQFTAEFKRFFDETTDEYDISIIFDEYFDTFIASNSAEMNKSILEDYISSEEMAQEIATHGEDYNLIASIKLHDILFKFVEEDAIDQIESDAETDEEEEY
jgi:hypothetical protein